MADNNQNKKTDESKKRTKKSKNRAFKIFKIVLLSIIIIGLIGTAAVSAIVYGIIKDAEPIDPSNIYELLEESSFILDADGQVIEKIQSDNVRIIVDLKDIPKHVQDAFVSIEDERFYTHNGIDLRGIGRAIYTNLRTGARHGASTINQQLAVNLYLSRGDRSYSRKIKDMYYGIVLDRELSKDQILEAYMNTINLGGVAHGVQAAAQTYFSKDVGDLTIAEAALIAGITRYPFRYSPIKTLYKDQVEENHIILDDSDSTYTIVFNEVSLQRQRTVLGVMRRLNKITEEEYQAALEEDIASNLKPNRLANQEITSYFGDLVKRDVMAGLQNEGYTKEEAQAMLYSGGLRIYSTMDVRAQNILEEEFENPANFPGSKLDEDGNLQPQAAMVIVDHHTGEIKALVGGRAMKGEKIYNRALHPRQPGSAIKPIAVYTPAVDMGNTAATVFDEVPVYFNTNKPNEPWPNNYNKKFKGLITMREAIQWSSNVVAVEAASRLGTDDLSAFNTMFEYMKKMGISTVITREDPLVVNGKKYTDETYSTALGGMTRGVTPLELTSAYGVLANKGILMDSITYTKVYDRQGNLLLDNKPNANRVLTPDVAYIMTDMLKTVVNAGTGRNARIDSNNSRIPVSGKTGTTSDKKDAWFAGYSPYYTSALWIGNDIPQELSDGSGMSVRLWNKIMTKIHRDYSPKSFEVPDNIVRVSVCSESGKLPGPYCHLDPRGSTIISEIFIKGTEPTEECDVHVLADIHVPSGKLATELTPPWEIESRVFIQRPVPYNPEENNGIVPDDYIYQLPTEYYDPTIDWLDSLPFPGNNNGTAGEEDDSATDVINPENPDTEEESEESTTENARDILRNLLNRRNNQNQGNDGDNSGNDAENNSNND
ncbi:transglycosylase domain-containing protein [Alkaliphilus hydrothermalis]|uniref:Penicillin-binding protein 1A n=1 Tax=Alkaliphilus hydrothermalis TaxID=1482730 RepID=A0ABS2NLS8_9FIRM|nr:PBP1A family penicillin-binding protein [Alkaliphilus hydrothermalis]MBM7613539.1 penicillin-binding protein 1A [Alkaliphilus hydrothermalis]